MVRMIAALIAAITLLPLGLPAVSAAPGQSRPGPARQLLEGCLEVPSEKSVAKLAESVEAIPYSASRIRRGLGQKDMTIVPDEVNPGEAQRTRRTVTAYRGWDLPGSAAGKLEYQEETTKSIKSSDPPAKRSAASVSAGTDPASSRRPC